MQELQRDDSVAIETHSEVISQECYQERTFISITNTSTGGQVINLAFGKEAQTGKGITLYPGGFYNESRDGINQITQKQISGISSLAGGTVSVAERVLMRGV